MEATDFDEESEKVVVDKQKKLARKSILDLENAKSAIDQFYAFSQAPLAYLTVERPALAKSSALESLELASSYLESWNYGNIIYNSNNVLGLVAFNAGETETAIKYLQLAGATPGSPQLASFGPNMQLAKELLFVGEITLVMEHLDACEKFWKSGTEWLCVWRNKIKAGEVPKFHLHLYT